MNIDKGCFQDDMTYGDFKDLGERTASDKVLLDKAFNIAKNPKYDRYQRGFAPMVYKFFSKKSAVSGIKNEVNNLTMKNKMNSYLKNCTNQLLENLTKK